MKHVHLSPTRWCLALVLSVLGSGQTAGAQTLQPGSLPEPAETILFVPYPKFPFDAELETTVYPPSTPGPWPLVVVNHGSVGYENPHRQERNRPVETARFFLERGYLVVAPMRQGFSRSTGGYSASNCDHARYAERFGADIAAVIDYFIQRGDVRADRVLVAGQSNGGMVTLGYAALQPKARAVINFAGGINSTNRNCDWAAAMVSAAKTLGAKTTIPSLWIYTEDDKLFPPTISQPFFEAYRAASAPAFYKLYPSGGHSFSTTRFGRETWGEDVEQFLKQVGLPAVPLGAPPP